MSTISWLGFALMVPGAIAAVIGHQRLVDIEYRNFHSEWVKDGRPVGGKESRRAASFWAGGSYRITLGLLDRTPAWIRESADAMTALRLFRAGVSLLGFGILGTIAVAIWLSS